MNFHPQNSTAVRERERIMTQKRRKGKNPGFSTFYSNSQTEKNIERIPKSSRVQKSNKHKV